MTVFDCDYCGQTGLHAKAGCVVLTLKCLRGEKKKITCRLLPESSWNCFQHFLIIPWREYIISRAISPVVGDQGRPLILFILLSCPLCCRHSLPCVWVTPTLTVIWALNIVLAFNTFQKWLMLLLSVNNILQISAVKLNVLLCWKQFQPVTERSTVHFYFTNETCRHFTLIMDFIIVFVCKMVCFETRFNSVLAEKWRLPA